MDKSLFFGKLFNSGEGFCIGEYKETRVFTDFDPNMHSGSFYCINPLHTAKDVESHLKDYFKADKPRRADSNVSEFRSFLFEMDSIGLEDQLNILEASKLTFVSITYSGSKSYHAVISLKTPLRKLLSVYDTIDKYKSVWKLIRDYIDFKGIEAGFELPPGKTSFIDAACQNPSRLSRFPGQVRDNGKLQELKYLGKRIDNEEFFQVLGSYPDDVKVQKVVKSISKSNDIVDTAHFWKVCPIGLKNKLRYVDWAASEGLYPELLKLTYWAIDSTGVDKDTFIEALWDRTFLRLIEAGYPERKLTVAIEDAYNGKRRL